MEITPTLHRIGNDIISVHLIVTPEGITLIDTGLPGHYADLRRELAALGRPLTDIKGIILTHGDSDHIGFAERLRKELDIPVYVGADDAARAQGAKTPATPKNPHRIGPALSFLTYAISKGGVQSHPVHDVIQVRDGDVLPLPGAPVIIGMPGHSPGSVAIHTPVARAVFVGDALTTRHVLTGVDGPQPAPFTDDQTRASVSLQKLTGLDVDWVIPGHGPVWTQGISRLIEVYRIAEQQLP